MIEKAITWRGENKNITWFLGEPYVKRTFSPSGELYDAIYSGVASYEKNKLVPLWERSTWNHLWDAVCCETISPSEAFDSISSGRVAYNLLTRASNYMHLVKFQ